MTSQIDTINYSINNNVSNSGYKNYINYITPIIIDSLNERGWINDSKNKVVIRYIANGLWSKLSPEKQNTST